MPPRTSYPQGSAGPHSLPQAVIFDCDGTLIDSEDLANEALRDLAVEYGIPLDASAIRAGFRGGRLPDYVTRLEALWGRPLPAEFVPEFRRRYREALATRLRPVPGVPELLAGLTLPMAVATNGQRAWTEANLTAVGLLSYFRGRIYSAHEVGFWKPDPALFLHAAKCLGKEPYDCVVVEDSLPGILAGAAAGMRVIAYLPHGLDAHLPEGVTTLPDLSRLAPLLTGEQPWRTPA